MFGTSAEKPRYKVCFGVVKAMLPHAVGRMFIDAHFSESAKQDTIEMINQVKEAFDNLLTKNKWMDADTKKAATEKASWLFWDERLWWFWK